MRIIDFLVSHHPIAKVLRDHLVFKIAPMLNPDGVYLGNYRCSLMGFDLNRHWANPSPWAHPTLHGVKQLIIDMYNNPDPTLALVEPQEVSLCPTLQTTEVTVNGITASRCISHSPQLCIVSKLAEGAFHASVQVIDTKVESGWIQY
ncbi:hypothetical protein WISP_140056 [Willisornis vidua]|uniref:Peptidase M14 domain-containing protein n=1 Tax=Willisornis vidua TaxID=1566151 RepID=A0ABQ9CM94_9PASS|nr:hypothetical protein WISP_140056 [Willisornis vidua]